METEVNDVEELLYLRRGLQDILGWKHSGSYTCTQLMLGIQNRLDELDQRRQAITDLYDEFDETLDELGVGYAGADPCARIRALNGERTAEAHMRQRYEGLVQKANETLVELGADGPANEDLSGRIRALAKKPTKPQGRGPIVHELKMWPEYFLTAIENARSIQVRKNDRDFRVGDTLKLREWDATLGPNRSKYTGSVAWRRVEYLDHTFEGMKPGYVLMRVLNEGAQTGEDPATG